MAKIQPGPPLVDFSPGGARLYRVPLPISGFARYLRQGLMRRLLGYPLPPPFPYREPPRFLFREQTGSPREVMAMRSSGRERVDSQIMRAKAVDLETTVRRRRVRRGAEA